MTIDKPSPMPRQLHIDQFARQLMFVRILSLIVVIYWIQTFGAVMATVFIGNFIDAVYKLPFMFALGFPAWVCWRSIDPISTATDPLTRIAYLVLGTICLIFVLIAGLAMMVSDIDETSPMLPGIFFQFFFWGVMTLLAAISLKRLRRTKIDTIGITLEELVRSMRPTPAKQAPWSVANLKSPGVLRFIVIATILLVIYS